jgi:hypothetical protein
MLGVGMILISTGPLRYARHEFASRAPGWRALAPALFCTALAYSLITFFTAYVHPFVEASGVSHTFGSDSLLVVAGIVFQSALLMGVILLLARRWTLPFGALTLLVGLNALLLTNLSDTYVLLPGVFVGGLIADGLLAALKPSAEHEWRWYVFAFVVPVIFFGLYFLTARLTVGLRWSVHAWLGTLTVAGTMGVLVNFLWASAQKNEVNHAA